MSRLFLNGEIIESSSATVSVADTGLLYGAGIFETIRAVNSSVFRLDDHLQRLFNSAKTLKINLNYNKQQLHDAVYDVLKANQLEQARIRLTVTNGPGNLDKNDTPVPTVIITATEFMGYPPEYYKSGVRVILANNRQNPQDPLAGCKTTSYYSRILTLNQAHQNGAAEALWFTTQNILAEGCVSNVFIVKNQKLVTPTLQTGILNGITRRTILQIAEEKQISTAEKDIFIKDLLDADEIFVSNVIMGVLPVVAVEAQTINTGDVGKLTKKLSDALNEQMLISK